MYRLFGIFAILTLLCISSTSGHDINYQFTSISVAEGLSQSTAQSILLDKKGKLWIGTKNGLNFYTGQNLKIFKSHPNDRYSLPSNHIIHLTQDSLNDIWISTRQGMVRYDETHGNFIPFNHDIIYSSLCINGGVLFGSENRIYKYDYQKRSFKAVCINPKGATDSDITKYRVQRIIAVSPKEVLIVTRRDGIYILNYPNMQLKRFFSCPNNILQGACLASNGYIYLSFWGQGLFCYEKTGKLIKQYTSNNSGLTNNYVLDIIEKKGYLWLATDGGGINRLELRNEKFSNLYHIAGDENSLPVNSITVLYKDSNECLWAGSVRGGVFNIKESYIRTYKDCPLGYNNGLSEKSVTSFYEEANGKLWIGTDGGGINLYDPQTGNFKHFSSTYGDKVISIAPVSEKELMVSVYTKGLFLFEKNTGIYRPFVIINDSINFRQCFYGYLPRAHRVTENKIYILSKELWVYNINNKKIKVNVNEIKPCDARMIDSTCDLWITDPPYADAVNYHELSEFFLSWDKNKIDEIFKGWYSDSKRILAVKGKDEEFSNSMIDIYSNLIKNTTEYGFQVVMFTHQNVNVWAQLALILWKSGLQVTAAWNVATETDSGGLKDSGNYVKGTVLLVLRKQNSDETVYLDELYPEIEDEVKLQIDTMRDLDDKEDPNFTDADYLLAAYAASLKILTSYKNIEDIDVQYELSKSDGESPIVDIINDAVKIAFDYLTPNGFDSYTWKTLLPEERFYIKGLDTEKNNVYKLSAYQELGRGFGVNEYSDMMANTKANKARLKTASEFAMKYTNDNTKFGHSILRNILIALYKSTKEEDATKGKAWLRNEVNDYWNERSKIIEILDYIATLEYIENMKHWEKDAKSAKILVELVRNDGV